MGYFGRHQNLGTRRHKHLEVGQFGVGSNATLSFPGLSYGALVTSTPFLGTTGI